MNLLQKAIHSSGLMLAFSNLSRSACFVLPVPILYLTTTPATVAFWLVATTIISLQNLLFLGIPQVLVRTLAYADAGDSLDRAVISGDRHHFEIVSRDAALRALVQFTNVIFLALSVVLLVGLATLGSWSVVKPINDLGNIQDGWFAWLAVLACSPLRVILLRQLTFLNGMGEVALPRAIDGIAWTVGGLLSGVALWLTGSLALMTLACHLPVLAASIIIEGLCRRKGWAKYAASTDWTGIRRTASQIWGPTWRTGVGTLLSTGARQGTGILFAQVGSPIAVAAYLLAQNAIAVVLMLSSAPVQSRLHLMSRARATGDQNLQLSIAQNSLRDSLWLVALCCGSVGLIAPFALSATKFGHAFVSADLWAVMSIALFLQRYGAAHLQNYSITNHIIWHWLDGITGLLNLAISALLVVQYGAWGVALGNLISIAIFYCWIPAVYSYRTFGMAWPKFDWDAGWKPTVAFIALVGLSVLVYARGAIP